MAHFKIYKSQEKFTFSFIADNGRVLLVGKYYKNEYGCRNAIHSILRNCTQSKKYLRRIINGKGYQFLLHSENGTVIGISKYYKDSLRCDNAIEAVMKNAFYAPIVVEFADIVSE